MLYNNVTVCFALNASIVISNTALFRLNSFDLYVEARYRFEKKPAHLNKFVLDGKQLLTDDFLIVNFENFGY